MKSILLILLFAHLSFASELLRPSAKIEQTIVSADGIDFQEWESEFDTSVEKAKVQVKKCETKSKNCQFEKFQALDPAFDMVQ